MEVSRLIFTKETKDKMEKELNATQRGVLRWNKIKEADEDGRLGLARNRNEVANIAGFTKENKTRGYQWVSNMIGRKHLREVMLGVGHDRKMEYEYHIVDDPDYTKSKAHKARKNKIKNVVNTEKPVKPMMQISEVPSTATYKIEITRGDMTIKIDLANYDEIGELVKAILKGE